MWSIRNQDDIKVWQEIEATSDRITAIVSAAFIEERLADAIKVRLMRDPRQIKKLFDPDGALGTYDAKVALGYLLNVYVDETRSNLAAIGSIRNRFAHRSRIGDFNHKDLESFFKAITLPNRLRNDALADSWYNIVLKHISPLKAGAPKRQRFLTTVQMLLAYLQPQIYQENLPVPSSHAPPF